MSDHDQFGRQFGRRVQDGGQWGTLVRCPQCHGSGTLHKVDESEKGPPVEPTDSALPVSRTVTAVWFPQENVQIFGHATFTLGPTDPDGNATYQMDFHMTPIEGPPQIKIEGKFPLSVDTDRHLFALLTGEAWADGT